MHLRPDIINEYQTRHASNDTRTLAPHIYAKPASSRVFDIIVRTPSGHGQNAFQAVLVCYTGNTGVDYSIVMLGDVNATVDAALADLLKKTCRRVGETTQGLVALFERSEAERRQNERNEISGVSSSFSNDRNREDESVQSAGHTLAREESSSGRNNELDLEASNNYTDQTIAEASDGLIVRTTPGNQASTNPIIHRVEDTILDTPSRGRKRWRSPAESSESETPQPEPSDPSPTPDFDDGDDIDEAAENEEEDYEDSIASNLGPASQWLVARREKRERQQNELATLNDSIITSSTLANTANKRLNDDLTEEHRCHVLQGETPNDISDARNAASVADTASPPKSVRTTGIITSDAIDLPMLDIAKTQAQSNIIYLLTGKRLPVDPNSTTKKTANTKHASISRCDRATQVHAGRTDSQPDILITPPTPSVKAGAHARPQTTNTSVLAIPQENNTILPLTTKNLAAVPVAEKMKSPWESQNDEEVAKLRVLQKQMKTMRKCLVDERLMEGQVNATVDA